MKKHELLNEEQYKWLEGVLAPYDCIVVAVHGSHLYGVSREGSDIDIKVIYAPSKNDMLLGDSNKTYNKKNDDLDIEVEIKSLTSFLKSAQGCDTNVFDMLHCPECMLLHSTEMWKTLREGRKSLYAKNMKGLIGYIKTHTKKYTHKIERFDEMSDLLEVINENISSGEKIKDSILPRYVDTSDYKFIKNVTLVDDHEQKYIDVCGKKYIHTWQVKELRDALVTELTRYGNRTKKGSDKGIDAKSLSHALRVLLQLKEIVTTNDLQFPLKDRKVLLDVKLGVITDTKVVTTMIDTLYDECMELLERSDLQEEPNVVPMLEALYNYYF